MFRCAFFSRSPVFRFYIYRQNLCTEFSCQSTAATTKCNKTWQFCCCEQQLSSNHEYNRNRKQIHCLQCWCLWYRLHKRQCYKLKTKTTQKTHPNKIYIYFQRSKGVCACDWPEDLYANIQLNVKSNAAARIHCAFRQIKLCVLYLLFCKIMCFIHLLFSSKWFCHAMDLSSWYPFSSQSCMFNRCK